MSLLSTLQTEITLTFEWPRGVENASSVGNLSLPMGARNQVGIGYRPASLCSITTLFQIRFLESIIKLISHAVVLLKGVISIVYSGKIRVQDRPLISTGTGGAYRHWWRSV